MLDATDGLVLASLAPIAMELVKPSSKPHLNPKRRRIKIMENTEPSELSPVNGPMEECGDCSGFGWIPLGHPNNPEQVQCQRCYGTGKVPSDPSGTDSSKKSLEEPGGVAANTVPRLMECEDSVIEMIRRRRAKGRAEHGQTMERDDLTMREWMTHAQEEALDFAMYLEAAMRRLPESLQ